MTSTATATKQSEFALQVRDGLTRPGQKELPSKFLYDDIGSALFELICKLPEYGLTRAEERILSRHSSEIVDRLPKPIAVAELGSGTGKKTRLILEALCRRHTISYYPIEISSAALACCERELQDMHSLSIVGLEREYLDGLLEVAARRSEGQRLLVLFLGSTIGNFGEGASTKFLKQLRDILWEGDFLLLGADLHKPVDTLLVAYDDPLGITAAFNRNLLVRINRELGADFSLDQFAHHVIFDEHTHSIEMHLRARSQQIVSVPAADITVKFSRDETIWTETCHKFSPPELQQIAANAGFQPTASWLDADWHFTEQLWQAK
ncbi:MAG TPA: L-histidine N(alpha)-methyltransferase [Verrucomicrobiae bacterium]|nr:L-histidine N(alpha)-methyltransferase [Verrucomicrobiae bacterium]